jgi:hypothetical protein
MGAKVGSGGIPLVHREEMDNALRIKLVGARHVCEKEMEGGVNVELGGTRPTQRRN